MSKEIKTGLNFNLLNELVEWHSEMTSAMESQKYIGALNKLYDELISKDILVKLIHNVNWEIEKLCIELERNNMTGEDVMIKLKQMQRKHLNYVDQEDLETSLQEYSFDLGEIK